MGTDSFIRPSRSRASTGSAESSPVRIRITVSAEGLLSGFAATGHAGTAVAGSNIACAAATTLLRTTGRLCAGRGFVSEGGAEKPAEMRLQLSARALHDPQWLRGVTDFLLRGMKDLQDEFPRDVVVQVETTED